MTRDEAVAVIQEGLGFRSDLNTQLVAKLKEAQRYFEMRPTLPWFLLEEDEDLNGTADDPVISLPAGFLRFAEGQVRYIDGDGKPHFLDKVNFDHIRQLYLGTTSKRPAAYALRSSSIYIKPTPDEAYTIKVSYYKKGALLDSNIENIWLEKAPDVLIGRAGLIQAKILGDDVAIQHFNEGLQVAVDAMIKETLEREIEDEELIMGSEAVN